MTTKPSIIRNSLSASAAGAIVALTLVVAASLGVMVPGIPLVSKALAPQQAHAVAYELYIGDAQVTDANKTNILGVIDPDTGKPTASFDPATGVLELHNPSIGNLYGGYCVVYSNGVPLKVKGTLRYEGEAANAFFVQNASLEFIEDEPGETDIFLEISYSMGVAIYCSGGDVAVKGGNISAHHSNGALQVHEGTLTFNGGSLQLSRSGYGSALSVSTKTINFGEECSMLYPVEWSFDSYGGLLDGDGSYASVVVLGKTRYDLYVGGVQVTGDNANDVLGNGTVSFEPATSDSPATLTLDNATIDVAYVESEGVDAGICIGEGRSGKLVGDLVIRLKGSNTIRMPDGNAVRESVYGIYAWGYFSECGSTLTIDGYDAAANGKLFIGLSTNKVSVFSCGIGSSARLTEIVDAVVDIDLNSYGCTGIQVAMLYNDENPHDLLIEGRQGPVENTRVSIAAGSSQRSHYHIAGISAQDECSVSAMLEIHLNPDGYCSGANRPSYGIEGPCSFAMRGGHAVIDSGDEEKYSFGMTDVELHLHDGSLIARAGKSASSQSYGLKRSSVSVHSGFFENGGYFEVSGYTSAIDSTAWNDESLSQGAWVNGNPAMDGATVWDGSTDFSNYKLVRIPGKTCTLTLHWSSIDGEDIAGQKPIVINGIVPGTKLGQALHDAGYSWANDLFAKDSYQAAGIKTPKPLASYASWIEAMADEADPDDAVEMDMHLYCLMAKNVNKITATVAPPVCGTKTATSEDGEGGWDLRTQTNKPQLVLPKGAPYEAPPADLLPLPQAIWGGFDDNDYLDPFIGAFEGGKEYNLVIMLFPKIGYHFTSDAAVTLEGAQVVKTLHEAVFAIEAKTTAVHDWDASTYAWSSDGKTCTATHVCSADKSHKETEKATVANGQITSKIAVQPTYAAKGKTTYTATFKNVAFKKQSKTLTDIPKLPQVWYRLYGSAALDTMAAITKEFGKASTAVVATNADFKDSLAAAALAGGQGAPMLTTAKGSLSSQTKSELKRMGVRTVWIVGSAAEVSTNTEKQIKALGITVKRVSAKTASERAVVAAKQVKGRSDTVIIATQNNYKDALSAASYAYASKSPIVFAETSKKLSSATASYIKSAGFKKAIIVGGPVALPTSIESQLKSAGIAANSITRLAGSNQYKTSRVMAEWAMGKLKNGTGGKSGDFYEYASIKFQPAIKLSANKVGVACGANIYNGKDIGWKDALAGSALCGKNKAILLLMDDSNTSSQSVVKANRTAIKRGYVFGGPKAVGQKTWDTLLSATLGTSATSKLVTLTSAKGTQAAVASEASPSNATASSGAATQAGRQLSTV